MQAKRFRLVTKARTLVAIALLAASSASMAVPGVVHALGGGSLGSADAQFLGEAGGHYAGTSVADAGDVNGDGYADLLIGASGHGDSGIAGAAYLVLGGPAGWGLGTDLGGATIVEYPGEVGGDCVGGGVAGAGDVNGDGYDDMLIGASGNKSNAGAAYLVLGSAGPSCGTHLGDCAVAKYTGEAGGDFAGGSVAGAGDVNGDGYADVLIGAMYADAGGVERGAAYLVLGSASPSDASLSSAITYSGEDDGDRGGSTVAGVGDVNGDGYDDMLIGASGNKSNAGAAYLVLGSPSPTDGSLSSAIKYGGEAESDGASRGGGAGDVDGDGYADILIGAPYNDEGGSEAGAAYLVLGNPSPVSSSLSAAIKYTGEGDGDYAGTRAVGAGDVNGDGYADLLIGAHNRGSGIGVAYLVMGSATPSGGNLSSAIKHGGEDGEEHAGYSAAGAGDVDGDGYADLLIGAPYNDEGGDSAGAAYLIFSDALSQDNPSYQHRRRLYDNSGDALPVEFDQAGVRVDFTAGALGDGSISVRRHVFDPCNTEQRLSAPIWTLDSNKVGPGASIDVRFKYTEAHVAGMLESNLKLWARPVGNPCGEWTEVSGSDVAKGHNLIWATVGGLSQFTIGESQPDPTALHLRSMEILRAGQPPWMGIMTAVLLIAAAVSYAYLHRHGVPSG